MTFGKTRPGLLRSALLGCTALAGAAGVAGGAYAQEAAGPSDQNTVGEIVVTAQKRAQNLQDVPIAVTALTQDTLQANRVTAGW